MLCMDKNTLTHVHRHTFIIARRSTKTGAVAIDGHCFRVIEQNNHKSQLNKRIADKDFGLIIIRHF